MLKVKDVMQDKVMKVLPDMSVPALIQLLQTQMIQGAPVVDPQNRVIGIVSLSDVASEAARTQGEVLRLHHGQEALFDEEPLRFSTVREIMNPVVYQVQEDEPVHEVIRFMLGARIHRAVVVRGETLVGIVSTTDFMRLCLRYLESPKEA